MEAYSVSSLVTIFTSLLLFFLAFRVGMMRGGHKISPSKNTNNEDFIIANRIHMNTLENVVVFIPILWVASVYSIEIVAGIIGIIWFLARVVYAYLYAQDPKKRSRPFFVSVVCFALMVLLAIYGIIFLKIFLIFSLLTFVLQSVYIFESVTFMVAFSFCKRKIF